MKIGRSSFLSTPLKLDTSGVAVRGVPMTQEDAVRRLDAAFANCPEATRRPGIISTACNNGNPSSPLSPRVQLAIDTGLAHRAPRVSREVLERAAYAAAKSDFPYDRTAEVRLNRERNGYPRHTYEKDKEYGLEILGAHLGARYVRPGDRIVDLGSGAGHYAKAADELGLDITAVDMSPGHKVFEHTIPSTVADFARQNKGRFNVAVSNHFSPRTISEEDDEIVASAHAYATDVASVLEAGGRFFCGISSRDPEYVADGHPLDMKAILGAHFGHVEVHWADKYGPEFERYGSVGGMMAIIECTGPRR